MIIFKDLMSGDELFTEASKPKLTDDGAMFQFNTRYVTVKVGEEVKLEGANPSAEEPSDDGGTEVEMRTDFDFVINNRLQQYPISSKKDVQAYFKGYFKALMEYLKEKGEDESKINEIKDMLKAKVPEWIAKYDNLSFFQGESSAENPLCVMVEWNEDGTSGTAYAWRCGLKEEKY